MHATVVKEISLRKFPEATATQRELAKQRKLISRRTALAAKLLSCWKSWAAGSARTSMDAAYGGDPRDKLRDE